MRFNNDGPQFEMRKSEFQCVVFGAVHLLCVFHCFPGIVGDTCAIAIYGLAGQ